MFLFVRTGIWEGICRKRKQNEVEGEGDNLSLIPQPRHSQK